MTEHDKQRDAAKKVEENMLQYLMQFTPARELKVGDILTIAAAARQYAFDAYRDTHGG